MRCCVLIDEALKRDPQFGAGLRPGPRRSVFHSRVLTFGFLFYSTIQRLSLEKSQAAADSAPQNSIHL